MTSHRKENARGMLPRCVCGKLVLPSLRVARRSVAQQRVAGRVLFIYRCEQTGAIHLTKRPFWDTRRGGDPRHMSPPRGETKGL